MKMIKIVYFSMIINHFYLSNMACCGLVMHQMKNVESIKYQRKS